MTLLRKKGLPKGREKVEVEPYSMMARYYDEIMEHVDYLKWAVYINRIVHHFHLRPGPAIDLACGTGKLALHLSGRGFTMTGVDGSSEMIETARRSTILRGKRIRFEVCNLLDAPPVDEQQYIFCLYDSVNYLMELEELAIFFTNVRSTVSEDGLFIFDCSTEHNSLSHFNGYKDEDRVTGAYYRRKSRYDRDERIQHNEFEFYPDRSDKMYYEHHQQRIWPIFTLLDRMEEHGFELLSVFDGYSFGPGDEDSDRVHIVASPI